MLGTGEVSPSYLVLVVNCTLHAAESMVALRKGLRQSSRAIHTARRQGQLNPQLHGRHRVTGQEEDRDQFSESESDEVIAPIHLSFSLNGVAHLRAPWPRLWAAAL
jgi:hypothetical protein